MRKRYLEPRGISQYRLAVDIGVPPRRINEIVLGKRGISADTALRLARYFAETTPEQWMLVQVAWELARAREALGPGWERRIRVYDPARVVPRRGRPRRAVPPGGRARGPRRHPSPADYLFIDE